MSKIQRYRHGDACGDEYNCFVKKDDEGEFVYYAEHKAEIDRLIAENKGQAERIVWFQTLVRDMDKNVYELYHKDALSCHGSWRDGYEHIPDILARIKQALQGDS